jgi:hypothetical protein
MNGQKPQASRLGLVQPMNGQGQTQSPDLGPASVEIFIEELVLHGCSPIDRYRLADAVQCELARLFTDQGVPAALAQGREIAHLDGGRFEVAAGSPAEAIGAQVAQALFGGLTR